MSLPLIYRNEEWGSALYKSCELEGMPVGLLDIYQRRKKAYAGILSRMTYDELKEFPSGRIQQTFINVILSECNSGEEIILPRVFDIRKRQVNRVFTRRKAVTGKDQVSISFPTYGHQIVPLDIHSSLKDFKPELKEAVNRYSRFKTIPEGFLKPCRKIFKI